MKRQTERETIARIVLPDPPPHSIKTGPLRIMGSVDRLERLAQPGDAAVEYNFGATVHLLSNGWNVISDIELSRLLSLSRNELAGAFLEIPSVVFAVDGSHVIGRDILLLAEIVEAHFRQTLRERLRVVGEKFQALIDKIDARRVA